MSDKQGLSGLGTKQEFLQKLGQRLREKEALFLNRQAAANACSAGKSSFQAWVEGKRDPSFSAMARFAAATDTSLDELAFGKLRSEKEPETLVTVPLVSHILNGPVGDWLCQDNIAGGFTFSENWLNEIVGPYTPGKLALTQIFGDSMEPTITRMDYLMIDLSVTKILDNALYAMQWDDALVVKRIARRPEGIVIMSDNKKYADQILNPKKADRLNIIGVIRWIGKGVM